MPRAILTSFFLGSALNFCLLIAYLFAVTKIDNVAIPGFGITGSCPTDNGNLPAWSTNAFPGLPNDGIPINDKAGGCILSNGCASRRARVQQLRRVS